MSKVFNIEVVELHGTWVFLVPSKFSELVDKCGETKPKVKQMIEKILENGMEWDVAFYGDLVAFKNSCDRTTTIYPKRYWLSRMRDSFQRLDTIQL